MRQCVSLFMALFILTLSCLPALSASLHPEELIDRAQDLSTLYKGQCLPRKSLSEASLTQFYESNGISEHCWKLLTEIGHLEAEIQKQQNLLENQLGCKNGECKGPPSLLNDLSAQITDLKKIQKNLSCTPERKKEVRSSCGEDLKCLLVATAMGIDGLVAEQFIADKYKLPHCHLGNDSCAVQLATGLIKAVYTLFEGAWDLLKQGGKFVGRQAKKLWSKIMPADNEASSRQLALARISEDEGLFQQMVEDFPGTMLKIFEGFMAGLKEWMRTDILCQKWSGLPHLSTCQKPLDDFNCLSCKTLANGFCAITGTLVAEVIPAFISGGVVLAAKHGARAGQKIAGLFKVSEDTREIVKSSKVVKLALEGTKKIDEISKTVKGLKESRAAIQSTLKNIKGYLLSPTRQLVKTNLIALNGLTRNGKVFLAQTKSGKFLVFSGKGVKLSGKILIFPIDNPMTAWGYHQGKRSFEKLFKLGSPKLARSTMATSAMTKFDPSLDTLLARIEAAKLHKKPDSKNLIRLEKELLDRIKPFREKILQEILAQDGVNFDDILKHLYPELRYGHLALDLHPSKILSAEKELYNALKKTTQSSVKRDLIRRYQMQVKNGTARDKVLGKIILPRIEAEILAKMLSNKHYGRILSKTEVPHRRSTAKALKVFENEGQSPLSASANFEQFEANFKYVLKNSPSESDAAGILAEYIKRQQRAGVSNKAIKAKLGEAFKKDCR